MKPGKFVLLCIAFAAFSLAADQKSDTKKPPAKAQEITIPADAVEIAPHTYRSTDPQGRVWIYHKTPFGVSRSEDKPVSPEDARKSQDAKDQLIQATTAVEEGDSVHFVRSTPFGRTEWLKKKTDLNDVEQAVWSRELAKRGASETASKD